MNELGAVPYVMARAGGAGVLVPLLDLACALPRSSLRFDERARPVAYWKERAIEVVVVAEALGLAGNLCERSVVLVHERAGSTSGLLVDGVGAVVWVTDQQRLALPDHVGLPFVSALVQTDQGMCWLLRLDDSWPAQGSLDHGAPNHRPT